MVRSNLSFVMDLVLIISGLDRDTFILVRIEVPDFQDYFQFSFGNIFFNFFILFLLSYLVLFTISPTSYNFYPT